MAESTWTVDWLVKLMSDDLPPLENVQMDYNADIDLHLRARYWGIYNNYLWKKQLLTSRVAHKP